MRQLWSFEFQKIVGRKLIRVALLAYGVLILILLSNSRVAYLDIFDQNGRHLHGKEALEYELKMAEQYRGPVTEEKVDALLVQEKQGAKNAGMNEAEYRLRTDWITGTAGTIWEEAPLSNPELQNSLQIGYTRGWETTLLSIESLFLIMGFLIIVAVFSGVFRGIRVWNGCLAFDRKVRENKMYYSENHGFFYILCCADDSDSFYSYDFYALAVWNRRI